MKSIVILFPARPAFPVGGYKVAYEYANRLTNDGYHIVCVYPSTPKFKNLSFCKKIRAITRWIYRKFSGYSARNWFPLNQSIEERFVLTLNKRFLPKSDVYIATAIQTAEELAKIDNKMVKKLYLIQDFENWDVTDEEVYKSYRLGLENIVISDWLEKKVIDSGASCVKIPNGFDFEYFKLTTPRNGRPRHSLCMMWHNDKRKGCNDGISAIMKVREKYPDLIVNMFGTPARPDNMPEWVNYHQCPDRETHNMLYQQSAIYLAPSHQEGWGLTVGEAMICGCAVVCTDTLGFREMVKDGENGLICPIGNPDKLAEAIINLFNDDSLFYKLAISGNKDIQAFKWEESYKKLYDIIKG